MCLLDLGRAEYLIISYVSANYYVQFAGLGRRGLLAEAACNTYIEPPNAVLTESQYAKALSLGWQPATDPPPELLPKGGSPRGSPNFSVRVGASTNYAPLARLAVKTLREVYRISHPNQLDYQAFEREGASIRFPSLGLPRASSRKVESEARRSPAKSPLVRKAGATAPQTNKDTKQARRRRADVVNPDRIRWIAVEHGRIGNDHGVEFSHEDVKGGPLAFIVGYYWLHEPGKHDVRVEILAAKPPAVNIEEDEWKAVLQEVKLAVRHFLAMRGKFANQDKIGKVSVWYNA